MIWIITDILTQVVERDQSQLLIPLFFQYVIKNVPHVEQVLPILPEHLSSTPVLVGFVWLDL